MGDCSNSRRVVTRFFRGRRPKGHNEGNDGFTLIEVVIAISLLVIMMIPFADAYVTSMSATTDAHSREVAAMLADTATDQARAIDATYDGHGANLLFGRQQTAVNQEWESPATGLSASFGIFADTTEAWDTVTSDSPATLPTTAQTETVPPVGGQTFEVYYYVGTCYASSNLGSNTCTTTDASGSYLMYRVIVDVTWSAPRGGCGTSGCDYITSTLVNGAKDPAFDVNPVLPYINSSSSTDFIVGNAGSFQVTSTGFPPPDYYDNAITGAKPCTPATLPDGVVSPSQNVTLATTGLLSGTPAGGTEGSYLLCLEATNTDGTGTSQMTLYVVKASPSLTVSGPNAPGTVGTAIAGNSFSAKLAGGYDETGTGTKGITMDLYSSPACTGTPVWSGTATANGNSQVFAASSDSFTPTASGDYWLSASYPGDPNNNSTTSTCGSSELVVNKVSTSMSITATPSTITYGSQATLAESGLPSGATGTVTFSSGSSLCTITLPTTPTSCKTSTSLTGGSYPVTATYSGDSTYAGTTSNTVTLMVDQAPATWPSGTSPTFTLGSAGSFQAAASGYPTPSYSDANFGACTTSLPAGVTFSNGLLSGTPNHGTVGTYTVCITATNSTGSTQQAFTLTVGGMTTSMSITATPSTITYGSQATLAESGLPSGATGTVTFSSGSSLCTITLPTTPTSCKTSTSLTGGSYPVTATYSGDSTYAGTTSNTVTLMVDQAPATWPSGTSPTFTLGSAGSFQAAASGYPTPSYSDANFGACTTSLPAGVTFSNGLLSGTPTSAAISYKVCITATNSAGNLAQEFYLTVAQGTPTVTVTGVFGSSPTAHITFTATVQGVPGGPNPTAGSITWSISSGLSCSTQTALSGTPLQATCKVTGVSSPTRYTATATYSGDTNYVSTPGTVPAGGVQG